MDNEDNDTTHYSATLNSIRENFKGDLKITEGLNNSLSKNQQIFNKLTKHIEH